MARNIDYDAIDDKLLEKEDMQDVLEELTDIGRKADDMGIALGLVEGRFDPTNMRSVIKTWLSQDYDTERHQLPSYRRLVKAVASKIGGSNPALAKKIAAKHPIQAVNKANSAMVGAVASDHQAATSRPPASPLLITRPAAETPPITINPTTETDGPGEAIKDLLQQLFHRKRELPLYLQPYPMNSSPHGICLIINNKKVDGSKERLGAERDEASLSKLFRTLGYHLHKEIVHTNCTSDQMISLVDAVAQVDHSRYDSIVVFLASHGTAGYVLGSDGESVSIEKIQSTLTDCKTLNGKPKIVFVQSCRGDERPASKKVQTDGGDVFIPRDSDFFFGYATTPKTEACRFTKDGSWFVIELCKIMEQHYTTLDLHHMVTAVHYQVAMNDEYVLEYPDKTTGKMIKYKQSPQIVTTLTRPVYFKLN